MSHPVMVDLLDSTFIPKTHDDVSHSIEYPWQSKVTSFAIMGFMALMQLPDAMEMSVVILTTSPDWAASKRVLHVIQEPHVYSAAWIFGIAVNVNISNRTEIANMISPNRAIYSYYSTSNK